jgi:hypothetical protein
LPWVFPSVACIITLLSVRIVFFDKSDVVTIAMTFAGTTTCVDLFLKNNNQDE